MKLSDEAKWFAIREVLSDYGASMTADEALDAIELLTDDVIVWEPFEYWEGGPLLDHTIQIAENAQKLIDAAQGAPKDLVDAVSNLGKAIENGDPQTIADDWVFGVKPLIVKPPDTISDDDTTQLKNSLEYLLARFESCVEGGSMINGDKEAIATAKELIRRNSPPVPPPIGKKHYRVRIFHDVEESAVISVYAHNEEEALENAITADHSDVEWGLSGDSINHGSEIIEEE